MKIQENVPFSELTTMRLGGVARYVSNIQNYKDIPATLDFCNKHNVPYTILGGGANTIAHDEGYNGVVMINAMRGVRITDHSPMSYIIMAEGGEIWDNVVNFTTFYNLSGIEALSKIPGSAGAAPVQNIGAYGQDISQVFKSANVYDFQDGTVKTLTKDAFQFSYRHSIMNTTEKGRYFVLNITLQLSTSPMERPFYDSIEKYIADNNITDFSPRSIRRIVSQIRADKLPDPFDKASSGSFFKNVYLTEAEAAKAEAKGIPVYHGHDGLKINAGWLIEQAGFKGKLLHGIRVSDKAALVLINESATSFADLAAARDEIRAAVKEKFGYELEQEPAEIMPADPPRKKDAEK